MVSGGYGTQRSSEGVSCSSCVQPRGLWPWRYLTASATSFTEADFSGGSSSSHCAVLSPCLNQRTRRERILDPLGGDAAEVRDDLVAVGLQRLFLPVGHEVDVELVDADRFELPELLRRLLHRAEHAEAVDDLVRHELTMSSPDAGVVLVVVELPRLDELREVPRDLRVLPVALDQIHDVIRDHRREPPRLLAGVREVVGDVTRRANDALELAGVTTCILGGAPCGVDDPLDDHRVRELDDHAVSHTARDSQRFRSVAGDPHRDVRQLVTHPLQLELLL